MTSFSTTLTIWQRSWLTERLDVIQSSVLFEIGRTVATQEVARMANEGLINPVVMLARHVTGDWGDLDDEDIQANRDAIRDGNRIVSKYDIESGESFYVITEWDRSMTTIMLTEEY